jgi:hypothetical protein
MALSWPPPSPHSSVVSSASGPPSAPSAIPAFQARRGLLPRQARLPTRLQQPVLVLLRLRRAPSLPLSLIPSLFWRRNDGMDLQVFNGAFASGRP